MVELLMEQVSQFKGDFPDVPLPSDIQLEEQGDAFFVTLPVGRVGAKSRSGRVYERSAVESLVRQINEKRPEGRWGHLHVNELGTRYDPPAIRWLAATLAQDGTAWAKGMPLTPEAREHFRIAKATNARVGTSVFGPPPVAEGNRVLDFELYSIDIADPARVGIAETAAKPNITAEMEQGMGEMDAILAEMREARDTAQQRVGQLTEQMTTLQAQVSEMQPMVEGYRQLQAVISEMADSFISMGININASGSDLADVLRQLIEKLTAIQSEQLRAAIGGAVTEMVALEALRPLVTEMLIDPNGKPLVASEDAAREQITAILARPHMQALAQGLVSEQAGPSALVGGSNNKPTDWRAEIAGKADELARQRGVK